jgi:hypothetical protein
MRERINYNWVIKMSHHLSEKFLRNSIHEIFNCAFWIVESSTQRLLDLTFWKTHRHQVCNMGIHWSSGLSGCWLTRSCTSGRCCRGRSGRGFGWGG